MFVKLKVGIMLILPNNRPFSAEYKPFSTDIICELCDDTTSPQLKSTCKITVYSFLSSYS